MVCLGIDEAGRGPLAGPVCAAAVILSNTFDVRILNDSKKMSEKRREAVRPIIQSESLFWNIGWASVKEIDALNILQASLLAMRRAFLGVQQQINRREYTVDSIEIIVDGNHLPMFDTPLDHIRCIPKADTVYPSVMAASILAKTQRDRLMRRCARHYPNYGFERHKGYGTAEHVRAIHTFGRTAIHRNSFRIPPLR